MTKSGLPACFAISSRACAGERFGYGVSARTFHGKKRKPAPIMPAKRSQTILFASAIVAPPASRFCLGFLPPFPGFGGSPAPAGLPGEKKGAPRKGRRPGRFLLRRGS